MPVPKKRTSHSRRNMRRSHHHAVQLFPNVCSNCGEPVLRHRVCVACGFYKGKEMLKVVQANA